MTARMVALLLTLATPGLAQEFEFVYAKVESTEAAAGGRGQAPAASGVTMTEVRVLLSERAVSIGEGSVTSVYDFSRRRISVANSLSKKNLETSLFSEVARRDKLAVKDESDLGFAGAILKSAGAKAMASSSRIAPARRAPATGMTTSI